MFDKIKNSTKYIIENSKYVSINYSKLDKFIKNIDCTNLKNWLLYNPYNLLELNVEKIINFLLFFEAIDYSFWGEPKWQVETKEGLKDGSDALLYVMLNYVKDKKEVDFSNLTIEDFKQILKGNIEIPLLEERYNTLIEISKIVKEKMNDNFYNCIKDITNDNELFSLIISNFPSFKDERVYKEEKVYFYKLAQLLTSDILHIRAKLEGIKVSYSNLIGCADYKIPQTLRALEIIRYNDELSKIIDSKKEIEVNSLYEIEIRASQIVVLEYIKNKLKNIDSIDINDFLFLYSKQVKSKTKPYHLCRNTNY